jgi:two-component system, NarL family, nitrate/nitrite response regulator NarL
MMYRFLICDDHALMRQALQMAIERCWPNAEIVTVADFTAAWSVAPQGFDLCICDLRMPGSEPVSGIRQLLGYLGNSKLLAISGSCDDETISKVLALGVNGIFDKTLDCEALEDAISSVLNGQSYILAASTRTDIETSLIHSSRQRADHECGPLQNLTLQQTLVLGHLCDGQTNKQIALRMGVAPSTVKFHVDQILKRLSAKNRAEAVKNYLSVPEKLR